MSKASLWDRIKLYVSQVIKRQHTGFLPTLLKPALWLLSLPFGAIAKSRSWMYDHKYLPSYSIPNATVISVGNIVVGGTGKTPVVLMLAEELSKQATVAILSRGYRAPAERQSQPVILSKGNGPLFPAALCGDEPYMLARRLPQAIVVVGRDRVQAAKMAVEAGAKILVVDDGMQHRRLQRDRDIVVINGEDPFGQGHYLPRGFLRESPEALARADLIVLTNVRDAKHAKELTEKLRRYTKAPIEVAQMKVTALKSANGAVETISGKRVGLFCAIAHPEAFERTISGLGAKVVTRLILSDHATISKEQLEAFVEESRRCGAEMIVCTEKDQVKLEGMEFGLPLIWPKIKTALSFNSCLKNMN